MKRVRLSPWPDRQRARVYNWENYTLFLPLFPRLPLDECQHIADAVMPKRPPEVRPAPRGARKASANSQDHTILLPPWGRTLPVVLHELAHLQRYADDGHGPGFMRAFIDLLARFGTDTGDRLQQAAADAGIDIGDLLARLGLDTMDRLQQTAADAIQDRLEQSAADAGIEVMAREERDRLEAERKAYVDDMRRKLAARRAAGLAP